MSSKKKSENSQDFSYLFLDLFLDFFLDTFCIFFPLLLHKKSELVFGLVFFIWNVFWTKIFVFFSGLKQFKLIQIKYLYNHCNALVCAFDMKRFRFQRKNNFNIIVKISTQVSTYYSGRRFFISNSLVKKYFLAENNSKLQMYFVRFLLE